MKQIKMGNRVRISILDLYQLNGVLGNTNHRILNEINVEVVIKISYLGDPKRIDTITRTIIKL